MLYSELLQRLYEATVSRGVKLGLTVPMRLNECLGFPDKKFDTVHIAGTNGKGSVTTKIAQAYTSAGYRTGLYTSPHIATFRERIKVDNKLISESDTIQHLTKLFNIIQEKDIRATFFEITTLLAFDYFAHQKVDIAIIETGLGGTLDATNIIRPLLSVITSISKEHTEILGTSIESIAKEKAGIIKPYTPIVIGPRVPRAIIEPIARNNHSPLFQVEGSFSTFDEENNAIAEKAMVLLKIPPKSIMDGIRMLPPCRMETIIADDVLVIADVAHNPDGIDQLFKSIRTKYPGKKLRIVCGFSKNKDIASCFEIILKNTRDVHLTEAANSRAATSAEIHAALRNKGILETFKHADVRTSVRTALQEARNKGQILVICGTFFIMADVRAELGIVEPRDPFPLGEIWSDSKK